MLNNTTFFALGLTATIQRDLRTSKPVKPRASGLYFKQHNACICGLGEVAAFLRLFAKKVTVYPNPARCTGYTLFSMYTSGHIACHS